MPIARVTGSDANTTGASGSVTLSFGQTTTVGNLLIAAVCAPSGSGAGSNTMSGWTAAVDVGRGATQNSGDTSVFYKISTGDTSATATCTSGGAMAMMLFEYSGVANPVVTDGINDAFSGSTSVSSQVTGTITTTNAGDLIFVANGTSTTMGASGQAWATATILSANARVLLSCGQYLPGTIVTGFQDTASWNTAGRAGAVIVAFKPVPGPVPLGIVGRRAVARASSF